MQRFHELNGLRAAQRLPDVARSKGIPIVASIPALMINLAGMVIPAAFVITSAMFIPAAMVGIHRQWAKR
jgi:hypothetical protein